VTSGSLTASATQKRSFEESRPKNNFTGSATYTGRQDRADGPGALLRQVDGLHRQRHRRHLPAFGAITLVDVAPTWKVNPTTSVRVGAENVFDTYPDEAVFQASRGLVYSRNSPYDTNGGQYYARIDVRF
jgi:iron complex outermembrane receptor protein